MENNKICLDNDNLEEDYHNEDKRVQMQNFLKIAKNKIKKKQDKKPFLVDPETLQTIF